MQASVEALQDVLIWTVMGFVLRQAYRLCSRRAAPVPASAPSQVSVSASVVFIACIMCQT